ncbi:hypothetical protein OIO90_006655, partial [Microbotryomycetes sp. JL221]
VYVGCDERSKAWRVADPITGVVRLSADVNFDERRFPGLDTAKAAPAFPLTLFELPLDNSIANTASSAHTGPTSTTLLPTTSSLGGESTPWNTSPPEPCTPMRPPPRHQLFESPSTDEVDTPTPSTVTPTAAPSTPTPVPTSPDPLALKSPDPLALNIAVNGTVSHGEDEQGYALPTGDPQNYCKAMRSPLAARWQQCADDEFDSLLNKFSVFKPVPSKTVPPTAKLLGSKWVFKTK